MAKLRNDYYELLEVKVDLVGQVNKLRSELESANRNADDIVSRVKQLEERNM